MYYGTAQANSLCLGLMGMFATMLMDINKNVLKR